MPNKFLETLSAAVAEILRTAPTWAGIFSDLAIATAAIVGTYIGVRGFRSWHTELLGRERHQAARELLRALRQLHQAAFDARITPRMTIDLPTNLRPLAENDAEGAAIRHASYKMTSAQTAFYESLDEAEAVLGEEIREKAKGIIDLVNRLQSALIHEASARFDPDAAKKISKSDLVNPEIRRGIIESTWNEPSGDEFGEKIENAASEFRGHLYRLIQSG
jgi:hypothetical protein